MAKRAAVLGQRLEDDVGVLVALVDHEDRPAAHAVQGLADDSRMLAQESVHVAHVARDQRGRAALREPGRVDLLVHVAQALRAVHDQRARQLGALEDVGRVDVLGVERRILAHQHDVEVAERHDVGSPRVNQSLGIVAHRDRMRAAVRHAVAQPEVAAARGSAAASRGGSPPASWRASYP